MMEALGSDASSKSTKASLRNIRNEIFQVPGFQHLNWLMVSHTGKKRSLKNIGSVDAIYWLFFLGCYFEFFTAANYCFKFKIR